MGACFPRVLCAIAINDLGCTADRTHLIAERSEANNRDIRAQNLS